MHTVITRLNFIHIDSCKPIPEVDNHIAILLSVSTFLPGQLEPTEGKR